MTVALDHIGPYRVLRSFASGGTAEVYEVQDPSSGECFALKYLVATETALKRFNREYEAMSRLNHPSIVRVYHYGVHAGHPWLTMEMLRGMPAQSYVKRSGRPGTPSRTAEVIRIGTLLARALAYIHARGLIHRDLKSANVLVLPDRRIKLLDFGAARVADAADKITLDGEFVGTFAYASPEQLQAKAFDGRSDLYSLGVLLYRLATGQRPFGAKEPAQLAYQVIHKAPPDPRTLTPSLPDALVSLLMRLLQKEPHDRPGSAEVVASTLERMAKEPVSTGHHVAVHTQTAVPRLRERRAVWARLSEHNPGDLLLIGGDAGSDRNRFLQSVADYAETQRWQIITSQHQGLRGLIELLRNLGAGLHDTRVERALEAMQRLSRREALARPRDRVALRRVAAEIVKLRARQADRPLLLLVRDLQTLHGPGLEILGSIRRALQADRVDAAVLASCRSPRLGPNALIEQHLPRTWSITLDALDQREVAVAVGTMIGHRPPPAWVARKLHHLTGGQPGYVSRVVESLVGDGALEAQDDQVQWSKLDRLPEPQSALQHARTQLQTLGAYHRRVLEALTLLGTEADTQLLAAGISMRHDEVTVILDDVERAGLVSRTHEVVTWRIPLMADVVSQNMSAVRRRALERALLYELEKRESSPAQVTLLAANGKRGHALRAALPVIETLVRTQKFQEALALIEPLIATSSATSAGVALGAIYLEHATVLQVVTPTDPRSARSLALAKKLVDGDPVLSIRIELCQARLFAGIGHYRNFRRHLTNAWELVASAPKLTLKAEVAYELGRSHRWHGDLTQAEGWFDAAVAAAQQSSDPTLTGRVALGTIGCLTARGRLDEAEAWVSQLMLDLQWGADKAAYWMALGAWSDILRLKGRYSEAITLLDQRLPDASQSQDRGAYLELLLAAARIEIDLARIGRAQERMDEIRAVVQRGEHLHVRLEADLLAGRISLESGRLSEAAWLLEDVHTRARRAELVVLAERARVYLAETLQSLGQTESSERHWRDALLGMLGTGEVAVVTYAAVSRARSTCTTADPRGVFRPVAKLLDTQPFLPARMEQLIARATWHATCNEPAVSREAAKQAAEAFSDLLGSLTDTERAALRVHPWSRRLRAVLP